MVQRDTWEESMAWHERRTSEPTHDATGKSARAAAHLEGKAVFFAVEVSIGDEITDGLDDLLQKVSLDKSCLAEQSRQRMQRMVKN